MEAHHRSPGGGLGIVGTGVLLNPSRARSTSDNQTVIKEPPSGYGAWPVLQARLDAKGLMALARRPISRPTPLVFRL